MMRGSAHQGERTNDKLMQPKLNEGDEFLMKFVWFKAKDETKMNPRKLRGRSPRRRPKIYQERH